MTHCSKFQVNKSQRLKVGGLLHPLEIPNGKWESISMDFIVGLPKTKCHHDSILVVVNRLTKVAYFIPSNTTNDAPTIGNKFYHKIFRLHGFIEVIISNRIQSSP